MDLPEPPRPDQKSYPPPSQRPAPPGPGSKWKPSTGFIVAMVIVGLVVVGGIVNALDSESDGGPSPSDSSDATSACRQTAGSWIDTLQSSFHKEYRDAQIIASSYVEASTSEGPAYYVAVQVQGLSGVAVFGTSEEPLISDPGLIAAANPAASQLSELGADIPEDSPAGALLLDDVGTSSAESCL